MTVRLTQPIAASSRFRGKSAWGLYGDVVRELDWSVGEIVRVLRETMADRNTLVVLSSDNGVAADQTTWSNQVLWSDQVIWGDQCLWSDALRGKMIKGE